MLIEDVIGEYIIEKTAWARKGKKIVRKVRCASGPRKGKLVSKASNCSSVKNIKKSMTLKRTKAIKGSRMARKSKKTKRTNAFSKAVRRMNKRSGGSKRRK